MSDAARIDTALDGLSELAACDLMLAKRFAGRIAALPEDDDDKAMSLARSYQRMARSYRQTVVVQARLRREAKAEAREDGKHARNRRVSDVIDAKSAIRARVGRLIWAEHEEERAEEVDDLLYDLVEEAGLRPDFLDTSVDAHVAAFADVLGLGSAPADAAAAPSTASRSPAGDDGRANGATPLFSGRLAPPMDEPWDSG